ncbi:hypothetical protein EDC44_12822 [Cricetibacter osteomyelitidis]|uniref:Uncharacterized protein n=1 Tax=Cricetibacter osteomyelitidis TaxID=1521931 RepID=A0A4R2SPJ9_9PAST|nr:hypothetical protein [Cricetibacter osteomyelitidis]TCP92069.1 hypothetical protein EDC44_12822 [Cricetibacter osteomyelitidis]
MGYQIKLSNKLYFPLLLSMAVGSVYSVYLGNKLQNDMKKNKDEVFFILKQEFGDVIRLEDLSRDEGYAFLYFSKGINNNYRDKLISIGYTENNDIFCYKGSSLKIMENEMLLFRYKYPSKICQINE